ncbi:MAG: hypothetical protein PHY92_09715 [Alphaproteobacteria bacterium]|nr:hypothetical protein [Alphaproteobacteria bacterium]
MKQTVADILASYLHDVEGAEEKFGALLSRLGENSTQLKPVLHSLPPLLANMDNGRRVHAVSVAKRALDACGDTPHLINGFVTQLLEIFPAERLKKEPVFYPLMQAMRQSCEKGMQALECKRDDGSRLINYSLREHHNVLSDILGLSRLKRPATHSGSTFFRRFPHLEFA